MASKQNFGVLVLKFMLFFTEENCSIFKNNFVSYDELSENLILKNIIATKHISANSDKFF